MNTKRLMRIQLIALFCACLMAAPCPMQAQGLLGKLKHVSKNIGKNMERKAVNKVTGTVNSAANDAVSKVTIGKVTSSPVKMKGKSSAKQKARDKQLNDYATAVLGPDGNRNAEDEKPTVRIPEQHTALFAPLGYDIDAAEGRLNYKPVQPPKEASKQVAWRDKQPVATKLTNESLVAVYEMLSNAHTYADMSLSPAAQYLSQVKEVLYDRCSALEKMEEKIRDVRSEYADTDTYNWVINLAHDQIVEILQGGVYKALVRSSIEPLFKVNMFENPDRMKEYFEKHGGLKDAHKITWTKWDPEPNKQQVRTSTGQKATVVSNAGKSGSTIDIGGVIYIIHTHYKQAYVKEVVKIAVDGKDIVIPDKVEHAGVMYPVTEIVASAFQEAKIRSIKLPSTLKEIGNSAFRGTALTEITIPASTQVVRGSAFADCKNLTKAVFAATSMKEIQGCFMRCPKLQSVTFPASLSADMSYDMFSGCSALTNVVLPKNLRTLPQKMFDGCKSLTKLDLPTTITKVDDDAFAGCSITSLYLPNVTEISESSFSDCKTLKSITINSKLKAKLMEENFWLFVTNFGNDNPNFPLKINGNTMSLPSSIKVL